ncbi:hypothetical protein RB195_017652 [Necator americanus]|uniref:Uncharacterized protein n=1 Tax=Necator americanus TaxID=51031 RepID=A0ABR1C663_NECAM
MAEMLEETSTAIDADRNIDQQNFACSQFEIFTHEYRERTEVPSYEVHGSQNNSCCSSPSPTENCKKRIVNTARKLQKAEIAIQRMPNSELVGDMLKKMRELTNELSKHTKQQQAEFSTKTVPLSEFDSTDMKLLMGDSEVPPSKSPFESLEEYERQEKAHLESLLFEADVMLREYEHMKNGLKA